MPNLTISLPDSLKEFVEEQVFAHGYGNVSEYFRTLLRAAQETERRNASELFLLAGIGAGDDIKLTSAYWKELRKLALDLTSKYSPKKRAPKRRTK